MSDTPRTDAVIAAAESLYPPDDDIESYNEEARVHLEELARQLERELAAKDEHWQGLMDDCCESRRYDEDRR